MNTLSTVAFSMDSSTSEDNDAIANREIRPWDTPPKSMLSRIGRVNQNRQKSRKNKFLHQLRDAFDKSDIENQKTLTFEAWKYSEIRNVIHDGSLSQTEYENYFKRIDVDCDGVVSWGELVTYLMKDIQSVELKSKDDACKYIKKMQTAPIAKNQYHRELVQQITICIRNGEYITVSSDSIRFWNPSDLSFNRALTDPGMFSKVLVLDTLNVMAVATTNRRLLLYEVDTLFQLPVEMSASPSPKKIRLMSMDDAKDALKVINSRAMPLYNVPMTLAKANDIVKDPQYELFWIGDDQGVLEFYRLKAPSRRRGTDFNLERTARYQMHQGGITQISFLAVLDCYGTSSLDNTVKFWTFDERNKKFQVTRVFVDQTSILGFHYSIRQKALTTCSFSRDAYVWSVSPPQKMFKLSGNNQFSHISDFITTTNDKYILTMSVKKEFRLWDPIYYRMVNEWIDTEILRPENRYGALFFDERRHALITAANFPVKWAEDISALNDSLEPVTHSHAIVGCLYAKEFNEIVTVDSICSIKVWGIETGQNKSSHIEPYNAQTSDICAVALDINGRRLISSSFKNQVLLWNYNSGTIIDSINLLPESPLNTILLFHEILSKNYLVRAGWDKTICIYKESEYNIFDIVRKFTLHKSDISAIGKYPNGIISGSVTGELYEWNFDMSIPVATAEVPHSASVECIVCTKNFAICGDSNGMIHAFSLGQLYRTNSISAHQIITNHSITSLAVSQDFKTMFSADTLGYIRKWSLNEEISDTPLRSFIFKLGLVGGETYRCSNKEITSIQYVYDDKFIVTCGTDLYVRMWDSDTLDYVGFFSETSNWNIHDTSTWIGQSPFEKEEFHFKKKEDKVRPQISFQIQHEESENDVLIHNRLHPSQKENEENLEGNGSNENNLDNPLDIESADNFNEETTNSFNLDLIRKTLDDYANHDNEKIILKQNDCLNVLKRKRSVASTGNLNDSAKRQEALRLTQRPAELIGSIKSLLKGEKSKSPISSKVYNSQPISSETSNSTSTTPARPVLKIPIYSPKKNAIPEVKKPRMSKTFSPSLFD